MIMRNILVVDDDPGILLSLKHGIERGNETLSVRTAQDGHTAIDVLKHEEISLVVTDLKMPQIGGIELLAHTTEHYPHIPVLMITAFGTPEIRRLARDKGAVDYIEKPFRLEEFCQKVDLVLQRQAEGGTLRSVSPGMFLQLVGMEQKTCTIRLLEKSSGAHGILFFRNGELLDARVGTVQGEEAAHCILSWADVSLSIQNECPELPRRIHKDLQSLLFDALRLKDETAPGTAGSAPVESHSAPGERREQADAAEEILRTVRSKLLQAFPQTDAVKDLFHTPPWDEVASKVADIGTSLRLGQFKLGIISDGQSTSHVVVPGKHTAVAVMDAKTPRNRLVEALVD